MVPINEGETVNIKKLLAALPGKAPPSTAFLRRQKGFSLTEVLVSIAIFMMVWLPTVTGIVACMYLSSYMKHRVQAAYWAQELLEDNRRITPVSQPSTAFSLDTNGTFNTTADDFTGNSVITVTNLNAHENRVQVAISWNEKIMGGVITVHEYYTTDFLIGQPQFN